MQFFRSMQRAVAMALLVMLVAACAGSRGGSIAYDDRGTFAQPDAPQAVVIADSYKLAPLDTVTVAVFQVSDLSRDYTIDLAGNITLPLVGSVSAINRSTAELAGDLKARLGTKYLQDPNVTVALKDSARRVVTVDGSVNQPGVYPAVGPLTLVQALALARGTDTYANPKRVAIFRQISGKRQAAAFDLTAIRRGESVDPAVYAGDTIVVDGSGLRRAQRDVLQNIPLLAIFSPFL